MRGQAPGSHPLEITSEFGVTARGRPVPSDRPRFSSVSMIMRPFTALAWPSR
jgi:hypothetical protein